MSEPKPEISPLLARLESLYREQPSVRILDIGGWFAPCKQATHMIDIMPFKTLNVSGAYGFGELQIRAENYHQIDLGASQPLPFPDKYFDFVVCRHTLEDIANPIFVCREIARVAKAGYLETPHRVYESTKGVERHWWAGHYHHRWFVEMKSGKIEFQFKPHNLHSSPRFHFRCPPWKKVREEFKNTWLLWENDFQAEERVIIDYREVQYDLREYKNRFRASARLRWRWAE